MNNDLKKFYKAYNKMMKHRAKKKELAEAICDYIMVAREGFLIELVNLINKEEFDTLPTTSKEFCDICHICQGEHKPKKHIGKDFDKLAKKVREDL